MIGFKLSNFVSNLAWDIFYGTKTSAEHFKLELWENLLADIRLGRQKEINIDRVLDKFSIDIELIKQKKSEQIEALMQSAPPSFKT